MSRFPKSPYRANGQPALTVLCYAERWNRWERKAVGILTEEQARKRHEQRKLYAVVLGDSKSRQPYAFLDVNLELDYVGVHFLDGQRRERLTYQFGRPEGVTADDPLFYQAAFHFEYAHDEDEEPIEKTMYTWNLDGLAYVEERNYVKHDVHSYNVWDELSGHWEPEPTFGEYDSITRFERPLGPLPDRAPKP